MALYVSVVSETVYNHVCVAAFTRSRNKESHTPPQV